MVQSNGMKVCARGEKCLHPKRQVDGKLPPEEFTSAGEEDEDRNRGKCRVCISWGMSTIDGALENVAARYNGDRGVALKAINSARHVQVDHMKIAVLLGISYNNAVGLNRDGKIVVEKVDGTKRKLYDKKTVLSLMNGADANLIKKLQKRSTQSAWEKRSRILNEDKTPVDKPPSGSPESTAIQTGTIAYTQQSLLSGRDKSNESEEVIRDLMESIKSYFMPTPPIMANAIKRAEKYLKNRQNGSEED